MSCMLWPEMLSLASCAHFSKAATCNRNHRAHRHSDLPQRRLTSYTWVSSIYPQAGLAPNASHAMACALDEAKAAAVGGALWRILGLPSTATKHDVCKARRQLQPRAHADKGGDPDLSALTNAAADELLARRRPLRLSEQAVFELDCKRRQDRLERLAREEQRRQETTILRELMDKYDMQFVHTLRDAAQVNTVRLCHTSGAREVSELKLLQSAGIARRVLRHRIDQLHSQGRKVKARALAYATERAVAARRIVRVAYVPRAVSLGKQQSEKAAMLAKHRTEHTFSWEHLRYVKKKGRLHMLVLLKLKRLRADAWRALRELPSVNLGAYVIAL